MWFLEVHRQIEVLDEDIEVLSKELQELINYKVLKWQIEWNYKIHILTTKLLTKNILKYEKQWIANVVAILAIL